MPWQDRMAGMAAGEVISSCAEIKIPGPYFLYDIIKMYWQKMAKPAAETIVQAGLEKMYISMCRSEPSQEMKSAD